MSTSIKPVTEAGPEVTATKVRRRSVTRSAGFKAAGASAGATGRELRSENVECYVLAAGEQLVLKLCIPPHAVGDLVAYGGWFQTSEGVSVVVDCAVYQYKTLVAPDAPNWGKLGSIWKSRTGTASTVLVTFTAKAAGTVAYYGMQAGVVEHKHLEGLDQEQLKRLYRFSPEANIYGANHTAAKCEHATRAAAATKLALKCCNRCARFLPVNLDDEQVHLSYTNHCTGATCTHGGFSRLFDATTEQHHQLIHGYQVECRFCKKFEVNAPLNVQRNAGQFTEVAVRRQALEDLVSALMYPGGQVHKDKAMRKALAPTLLKRYGNACFNCAEPLTLENVVLDHTRPIALLWPLDETATCLCGACNSEKRDRLPSSFYTKPGQLQELARLTGISVAALESPLPNMKAVTALKARIDWFFSEFCQRSAFATEFDGKAPLDLFVHSIQKILNQTPGGDAFNLISEYEKRKTSCTIGKSYEQYSMF